MGVASYKDYTSADVDLLCMFRYFTSQHDGKRMPLPPASQKEAMVLRDRELEDEIQDSTWRKVD